MCTRFFCYVPRYRDDLGNAIANFARVVPDGLLVFFPAYSLLTACLDHWKASTGAGECGRHSGWWL
jgi:regulator of telomere elongation helicase 1